MKANKNPSSPGFGRAAGNRSTRRDSDSDRRVKNVPTIQPHLSVDAYFDVLENWLDLEAAAERERLAWRRQMRNQKDVEKTGETIVKLRISDHRSGLAGRVLLDLQKDDHSQLPMNRLKVGSPVVLSDDGDPSDSGLAGVVSRRTAQMIQVAVETFPEGLRFRLDLSPDETTRRRQLSAMAKMRTAVGRPARLRDVMMGNKAPRFSPVSGFEWFDELNPPQEDAVQFAVSAGDVAVIHGPPGTGKTTTIAEVIYQLVREGERVLACAPSNTAVDNLLEKLVRGVPDVVRLGHPARVLHALRDYTLDERVIQDRSAGVIRELRRELDQVMRQIERLADRHDGYKKRGQLRGEAGQLRGQIRSLEKAIIRGVMDSADVICTTTTVDDDLLGDRHFDTVVIDEACQATMPGIWQAVLRGNRVIFAGDHQQLPPTVLSEPAAKAGMIDSMMHRLVEHYDRDVFRRLTVQYRMNEDIMRFSSDHFYDGELEADVSVKHRLLADLDGVGDSDLTSNALLFIDTAGADYLESIEPDGESKLNLGEAKLVLLLVKELMEAGIDPAEIAIIAPYAAQVRVLRNRIDAPEIEIDTVDGFQGREKEVVILSMVRSNDRGEIGFLADTRRTNVALTRAKRKLIMIGDSATLSTNSFYESVLKYFDAQDAYRSVFEWDV
ncbi:MAG: AAA domain-containing protein [Planctomycetota bacterium]